MTPLVSRRDAILAGLAAAATAGCAVAASGGEVLRATDFGARGQGAAVDDTAAIQRAIDAAAARGGGTVLFDATPAYYQTTRPLCVWSGVSLAGDGGYPEIRSDQPRSQLLFLGSLHPAFVQKLRFDPLRPIAAGARTVTLGEGTVPARYRVGDQVLVASDGQGPTGPFRLSRYAWLNTIVAIDGPRLVLREPIDVSVPSGIAPLKEGQGRFGVPLFFYADGTVSGLRLTARYHAVMDSAALAMRFHDNVVRARSGIYGNAFQGCVWSSNKFYVSNLLGEQSETSLNNLVTDNEFFYTGGAAMPEPKNQYQGLYFQEYARNIRVQRNVLHMNDFRSNNFCISIALAQNIVVDGMTIEAEGAPSLVYMGALPEPLFDVFGNFVRNVEFDTGQSARFVYVDGHNSPAMRGNGIEGCRFAGSATAPDMVRLANLQAPFAFDDNVLPRPGGCDVMGGRMVAPAIGNIGPGGVGVMCRPMG